MSELWSNIIPAWLSAIGTFGAVLFAIFGKAIVQWWNRPKIKIIFENKEPYIETLKSMPNSSITDKEIRIRVRIKNEGKYTASHCIVNINQYYSKRKDDDTYYKKEFAPIQIRDYQNKSLEYIAPNIDYYYLDIASIRQSDEIGMSDSGTRPHQFYKLFIIGGNKRPLQLGKGTFIIPININSPNMKSYTAFLKIYWNSNDYTTEQKNFTASNISEKEFKSLKKL